MTSTRLEDILRIGIGVKSTKMTGIVFLIQLSCFFPPFVIIHLIFNAVIVTPLFLINCFFNYVSIPADILAVFPSKLFPFFLIDFTLSILPSIFLFLLVVVHLFKSLHAKSPPPLTFLSNMPKHFYLPCSENVIQEFFYLNSLFLWCCEALRYLHQIFQHNTYSSLATSKLRSYYYTSYTVAFELEEDKIR